MAIISLDFSLFGNIQVGIIIVAAKGGSTPLEYIVGEKILEKGKCK